MRNSRGAFVCFSDQEHCHVTSCEGGTSLVARLQKYLFCLHPIMIDPFEYNNHHKLVFKVAYDHIVSAWCV